MLCISFLTTTPGCGGWVLCRARKGLILPQRHHQKLRVWEVVLFEDCS